jgi:uncharacterized protein (DUF362 family)
MGIDPHEISHIKNAAKKELGSLDNIEVVGEQIDRVKRTFKRK